MKMHPSHRPCHLALAALPARSRTIDLRGNVTHTGNLGPVPKVPILKYRIILRGQANIMQIAYAVAGSVPKFFCCKKKKEELETKYRYLYSQAVMKSASYDTEGKSQGGVYPR